MSSDIVSIASVVGSDWTHGEYYDLAEGGMEPQWNAVVWPIISDADFTNIVEIAAGHGRNTAKLIDLCKNIKATDINRTNIEFLRSRFNRNSKIDIIQNNGADLRAVPGGWASLVYCFDAMVHFDSDVVRSYLKEIRRILKPGGRAFIHYSLFDKDPMGTYRDHPGWRNFMSRALFEHWIAKEGMRLVKSSYVLGVCVPTENPEGADGISYFELPHDALPMGGFVEVKENKASAPDSTTAPAVEQPVSEYSMDGVHIPGDDTAALRDTVRQTEAKLQACVLKLQAIETSTSWRVTGPLRKLLSLVRG